MALVRHAVEAIWPAVVAHVVFNLPTVLVLALASTGYTITNA